LLLVSVQLSELNSSIARPVRMPVRPVHRYRHRYRHRYWSSLLIPDSTTPF
jgi:hypothetical protein